MTYAPPLVAQTYGVYDSMLYLGPHLRTFAGTAAPASATWPAANRAYYCPILIYDTVVANQMYLMGGTSPSGNIDIGLYAIDGTRLFNTGSTAVSGTTDSPTMIDITDTAIYPGRYYLAVQASATTVTARRVAPTQAGAIRCMGMLMQSVGSFGLPSSATFAAITDQFVPLFGFTTNATSL